LFRLCWNWSVQIHVLTDIVYFSVLCDGKVNADACTKNYASPIIRRYILGEPFRHRLNSNPDTHIIKKNWIIKMLFSKYTEMMNKSNKANKWENSVT
jgi:hypothetical protein